MAQAAILEGAESFEFGDGPVGALLVHGFTSTPHNMLALGRYLAERGVHVSCPRLPGHGTTWQDLNKAKAEEWVSEVDRAFTALAAASKEVFVVGLSFGGALSIELAARHKGKIKGLVTIAGFVQTRDPRRFAAPLIRILVKALPNIANDIADPDQKEIAYDKLPTGGAYQMLKVLKRAQAALPQINVPILIMHSHNDHTVLPFNAEVIHGTVASEDKELVWMDRSYHVLTMDYDRDEVVERTWAFIRDRSELRSSLSAQ